jgi:hypothetical protein
MWRYTVHSLIKLNATVTSWLLAGNAWLTAKCYKVFLIWVNYRSIKTIKSTYHIIAVPAGSQEITVAFNFISECTLYIEVCNTVNVIFCGTMRGGGKEIQKMRSMPIKVYYIRYMKNLKFTSRYTCEYGPDRCIPLDQGFPNGVSRHPGVSWGATRCVAKLKKKFKLMLMMIVNNWTND